jgi:hypothetical protein
VDIIPALTLGFAILSAVAAIVAATSSEGLRRDIEKLKRAPILVDRDVPIAKPSVGIMTRRRKAQVLEMIQKKGT